MIGKKYLILFTLFAANLVDQLAPEVTIEQGTLVGKISDDGTFFMYLGIPYATATVENRFKAPLPPPQWKGVYRATEIAESCLQVNSIKNLRSNDTIKIQGEENCLKINVYVPAMTKRPLPVMVFVHGGAFIVGSGGPFVYGPEFLVKHDVILVTFNYRLGALGFLCLGIKEAPGNAGLKDQVAALRWVKKNIGAFGGDPNNVTIFGESAGAMSVSLMLASNITEGLFQKAIVQSGSSLSNWATNRRPVWVASLLAKEFGFDTVNPYEIFNILSKIPLNELISKSPEKPFDLFFDTELIHLPCVEKHIPGVEPFITDIPFNIIENNPRDIPVIFGSNSKEGLFLVSAETEETLEEKNLRHVYASDLEFESDEIALNVSALTKKFYFGNDSVSRSKFMNVVDLYTHLYFEVPTLMEAEIMSKSIKSPVYTYNFNYSGGRNAIKYMFGFSNETGACHADELMYLFNGRIWPFWINKKDRQVIDWMTKLWTNFAKFGDPTPNFAEDIPVKWKPNTKESLELLHIDEELKMGPMPNPDAFKMWKDIYNKYRIKKISE